MRPLLLWLTGWLWVSALLLWPAPAAAPLLDGEPLDWQAPPPGASSLEEIYQETATLLQEYSVSLPFDPKSGLGWRVAAYDRDYLELQARRYRPAPTSAAPAQEIFVFLPRKTGRTSVTLHYQRPFDRQPAAVRVYQITIR